MTGSFDKAESIAKAVLYEGYMLYPYRASAVKNRQRCTFGTLFPAQHPDVLRGAEPCGHQMQCLVKAAPSSTITARVRFLHLRSRLVEACNPAEQSEFLPVDAFAVGSEIHQPSDEAVERTVEAEAQLGELLNGSRMIEFEFPPEAQPASCTTPPARSSAAYEKSSRQSGANSVFPLAPRLTTRPTAPQRRVCSASPSR